LSLADDALDDDTEYWLFFVNKSHRLTGPLLKPGIYQEGVFYWTFSDQPNTYLGIRYTNGEWSSVRDIEGTTVSASGGGIVFVIPLRKLREAGVDTGSEFGLYAYAHTMTVSDGDGYRMRVNWDSAGLGAAHPPATFNNEPEDTPAPPFLAPLAIALVAAATMAVAGRRRFDR
jgi:hypothetical protein